VYGNTINIAEMNTLQHRFCICASRGEPGNREFCPSLTFVADYFERKKAGPKLMYRCGNVRKDQPNGPPKELSILTVMKENVAAPVHAEPRILRSVIYYSCDSGQHSSPF